MKSKTIRFVQVLRKMQQLLKHPNAPDGRQRGICGALMQTVSRSRTAGQRARDEDEIAAVIFPSKKYVDIVPGNPALSLAARKLLKFEAWEADVYWIDPIGGTQQRGFDDYQYTTRIILLELTALMLTDGSIETPLARPWV